MKYWRGYKYVVAEDFVVQTSILRFSVADGLTALNEAGVLTIRRGYAWDGNSGPVMDIRSSLLASCVHDVLCDYINMGLLPDYLQPLSDQEYYQLCVKNKMWWRLARWCLLAIRWYMVGKGAKRYTRMVHEA